MDAEVARHRAGEVLTLSRATVALGLSALLLLEGCASYTPTKVELLKPEAMPLWVREGVVAVGADPYIQTERQKVAFDGDMGDQGILPVQVFVLNEGQRRLLVRSSDMILLFPDGRQVASAGATAVAARFDQGVGDVIGWGIGFGVIGMLAASAHKDSVRTARLNDYRSKELSEAFLDPGKSAHGFVFFMPSGGPLTTLDGVLVVQFVDAEDASRQAVRVPLRGTGEITARMVPESAQLPERARPVPPAVAELIGVWSGREEFKTPPGSVSVTLRISAEDGRLRWTLTRPPGVGTAQVTASGAGDVAGGQVTLTGRYDAGSEPLSNTPVSYSLSLNGSTLTGGGLGADNIVHVLSLERASSE